MNLQKVAVVTGGANGIGLATCELFVQQDYYVYFLDIDHTAGQQAQEKFGLKATFLCVDVSKEDQVQKAFAHIQTKEGRIDCLVNNAATFIMKGLDASVEEWHKVFSVNVLGVALCSAAVAPLMKQQKKGSMTTGKIY